MLLSNAHVSAISWDDCQRLRRSREAAKAAIPLSGRLATLKASRDNLMRLGRLEEAQKVRCPSDRTPPEKHAQYIPFIASDVGASDIIAVCTESAMLSYIVQPTSRWRADPEVGSRKGGFHTTPTVFSACQSGRLSDFSPVHRVIQIGC